MPFPQRSRSAVSVDQQSVLPAVRGIPWWGAVLVAAIPTALGAAIDANKTDTLGSVFNFLYLVGCVAAALAVRRRALFTAAAQPPLIAFAIGIATLYGLNADEASGLKALVFKVLLPIANDFPWMALTFIITLLLVIGRWYLTRSAAATDQADGRKDRQPRPNPAKNTKSRSRAPRPDTASQSTGSRASQTRTTQTRVNQARNSPARNPDARTPQTRNSQTRAGRPKPDTRIPDTKASAEDAAVEARPRSRRSTNPAA
ncbi:MAG: hypothetical protein QM673_11670, partial [Gordonia sp. (in: high G+C Gram-positive bacteria)]